MITLATLPEATAQEVFDQVAEHLLTQNERSAPNGGWVCRYRHEHLKCAAGCLIGDDEYDKKLEGTTWNELVLKNLVPREHCHLIRALQRVHDNEAPHNWKDALQDTAKHFNLNFNK